MGARDVPAKGILNIQVGDGEAQLDRHRGDRFGLALFGTVYVVLPLQFSNSPLLVCLQAVLLLLKLKPRCGDGAGLLTLDSRYRFESC